MATQTKRAQVEEQAVEEQSPFFDAARRVMLASIGAIALAQDEIEEFINRLVERGEIAENGTYLHARQKRVPQGRWFRAALAVPENAYG